MELQYTVKYQPAVKEIKITTDKLRCGFIHQGNSAFMNTAVHLIGNETFIQLPAFRRAYLGAFGKQHGHTVKVMLLRRPDADLVIQFIINSEPFCEIHDAVCHDVRALYFRVTQYAVV